MTSPSTDTVRSRIETVVALAGLLERVEHSRTPLAAGQYQGLVRQLTLALGAELPDAALQAVLGAYPATAELYENLHYAHSGLSRASLERSVQSEMLTSQVLAKAAKHG